MAHPFQKPEGEELDSDSTGRCNFRLPIKTYQLMREMAAELGIESVSGAARHFCIRGIQVSMGEFAVLRSTRNQAEQMELLKGWSKFMEDPVGLITELKEREKGDES